jgi:hypothetical protein
MVESPDGTESMVITQRPSNREIDAAGGGYKLDWLIENQVLTLTGGLRFATWGQNESAIPLEDWNAIQGDLDLVSESTNRDTQNTYTICRNQWLRDNPIVYGYPEEDESDTVLPFKLEVNPRIQFHVHITLSQNWVPNDIGASGVLEAGYFQDSDDYSRWGYDTFETFQGGSTWGLYWLDIGMVEGDYIQWDGTYFDVVHYGQVIFRSTRCLSGDNIIPLGADNLEQTEEQAEEQGRMDDPLTEEDETIDLDPDGDGFRPPDYNKDRLAEIRRQLRFQNRGRKTIGGILFLIIGVGLVYFFTKSRIFNVVKEGVGEGIEGVGEVV